MTTRTNTPTRVDPDTGTKTITVKRCCNGCGQELGDATEAEMRAAMSGEQLPDVREECATCTPFESLVFQALGAASVCWDNPAGAGVFDADRAKEIGETLVASLRARIDDELTALTAQRDQARDIAARLEAEIARMGSGVAANRGPQLVPLRAARLRLPASAVEPAEERDCPEGCLRSDDGVFHVVMASCDRHTREQRERVASASAVADTEAVNKP